MQDGLPTESLWLMLYTSIILDSNVEVEAQVQEPEQGEASGDVWGVGLEDIFVHVWRAFWEVKYYILETFSVF